MTRRGRVLLVTGAASGLGWALSRLAHARGDFVVLADRDVAALEARRTELPPGRTECVVGDVTVEADRAAMLTAATRRFGGLDVLVNNAGIAIEWEGRPTDADKVRRTLEVNLIAPFAITEALVPLLARSDDARIINHSSMLGSIGTAESMWKQVGGFMAVGYSTSKAGLNMLTLIQSKTLAGKGIAVAAAHPGWVKTDLGTQAAPLEVDEGAGTVVDLVTMAREKFPNGQLWHKGARMPW